MKHSNKNTDKRGNKDWRKPYKGSKAFDTSCRHGGDCPRCINNRQFTVKRQSANNNIKDYEIS